MIEISFHAEKIIYNPVLASWFLLKSRFDTRYRFGCSVKKGEQSWNVHGSQVPSRSIPVTIDKLVTYCSRPVLVPFQNHKSLPSNWIRQMGTGRERNENAHLPHYFEGPDKIFYRSKPILDQLKLYRKWYSTGQRLLFIASDLGWRQNSVSHLLIVHPSVCLTANSPPFFLSPVPNYYRTHHLKNPLKLPVDLSRIDSKMLHSKMKKNAQVSSSI